MQGTLNRHKIRPKRDLGQHFLTDKSVLEREVAYAQVGRGDTVLEIGAGIGNLTKLLLQRAGRVFAIEVDRQFEASLLELQGQYDNLEIVWGDALEVDFPRFDKVVANLPYKVALPITFKLLDIKFERGILIYQQRLAQRICASVEESGYSRLGVSIGRRAQVQLLEAVGRDAFHPRPEVDSAMVELRPTQAKFDIPSEEFFKLVLEQLFAQRTKSVQEAVRGIRHRKLPRPALERALENLRAQLKKRQVSRVAPRDFGRISWALWSVVAGRKGTKPEPRSHLAP